MKNSKLLFGLAIVFGLLLTASFACAGNKKLMSLKMAKQDLKRNLVESIVGYKVKSEGKFGLTEDASFKVDTKAAAVIKGVVIDECVYDKDKDIAMCYGHIDLDTVQNILGDYIQYKNVTLDSVGFGTMTQASRPPLQALRAAMLDAYNQLAVTLVGEKIYSRTGTENYLLTKDVNRSKACAAVYGAHIPQESVKFGRKGWGWDSEDTAYVVLQLDVDKVRDLLGNELIYKGENIIEVMGQGTYVDDLSELRDQESGNADAPRKGTKVREATLDIPVNSPTASDDEAMNLKGGAEAQ